MKYKFKCSVEICRGVSDLNLCAWALHLAASVSGCFLFNGSIQDICACQKPRRNRWGSSLFKGQENHVKLPLFTPVTKWTGLDTNCLPMRSLAKSNGTDGKRKKDTSCFYSVHLLPTSFLPSLVASQHGLSIR